MTRLTAEEFSMALATHEIVSDTGATDICRTEAHRTIADGEDEKAAGKRFWEWVIEHEAQYPQLRWLTHHESGGYRPIVVAARLKAEGQKAGFPDYALYWISIVDGLIFVGWAMELKRADRTNHLTGLQKEWLNHLKMQGWKTVVCYGADEAIASLIDYLGAVQ